jgi:hypothetical protein
VEPAVLGGIWSRPSSAVSGVRRPRRYLESAVLGGTWSPPSSAVPGARRPRRYLESAVLGGIWSPPSSAVPGVRRPRRYLEPAVLGGIRDTAEDRRLQGTGPPGARRPRRYLGYGGGPPAPGNRVAWSPPSSAVSGIRRRTAGSREQGRVEPAVLGGIWDTAEDRRLQGTRRRCPGGVGVPPAGGQDGRVPRCPALAPGRTGVCRTRGCPTRGSRPPSAPEARRFSSARGIGLGRPPGVSPTAPPVHSAGAGHTRG